MNLYKPVDIWQLQRYIDMKAMVEQENQGCYQNLKIEFKVIQGHFGNFTSFFEVIFVFFEVIFLNYIPKQVWIWTTTSSAE